jgi:flavin reductase (DIM6/NTAB) family NADH-FMN oxidoreductase RutF
MESSRVNAMSNGSIFSLTNPEIYVLTAAHGGAQGGQVVTWLTLASLVPESPRVMTAISPFTHTFSLLEQSGEFVVNLLAREQAPWLVHFGLQSGHTTPKLQDIAVVYTPSGVPILPETCGWAWCRVAEHLDLGDRRLIIADVVDQACDSTRSPLRRVEGLADLPATITQALATQRQADIERDRPLRHPSSEAVSGLTS